MKRFERARYLLRVFRLLGSSRNRKIPLQRRMKVWFSNIAIPGLFGLIVWERSLWLEEDLLTFDKENEMLYIFCMDRYWSTSSKIYPCTR